METKNPLMPIMLVSILSIAQSIIFQDFSIIRIIAVAIAVIFLILYFTKSKLAGSFNFFGVALIYPIYFLGIFLGFVNAPTNNSTYIILGVIYLISMAILWFLKKKYDAYFIEQQTS
jgi:hypothetical protein